MGVLLVTVIAASVGCGGDDGEAGSTDPFAERSGLESTAVLDAICDNWEMGLPHRATVNQYVHDLLAPIELVNAGTPPDYTNPDIDTAVAADYDHHAEAPAGFLAAVRGDLGISEADLDGLVEKACARYRVQQTVMAAGRGRTTTRAPSSERSRRIVA